MKKLITYLKALWSWVADSQRKQIGVTLGEATIEHPFSIHSASDGTRWKPAGKMQKVMSRMVAVVCLLLTLGVGNVWGATRTGWTRVTSVAEITAGGTFIVGWENSANSNTVVPMINKPSTLTGTTGNNATSYLYSGTANASNNTTIDMSDNGSGATTNYEFEFVAGSSSGTIAIKLSDNTYVGFYGSSNNNCRRYASVGTNASFTPTISSGIVTLTNVQYNSRKLSFNNNSGSYRFSNYSSSAKIVLYKKSSSCSNSVGVTKGSESHGEVTTIGSASVATCSSTASDRQVTITVTPDDCYDAPSTLTWTKSSGTVSASKQSGPTDNGDGTYSYVYQFAQNDNGAGTFGVTCTAKSAGYTVNFDAGPGVSASSSLTETCSGSGVTLPAVTATGVCKGWTTFAGWATAPVSDSTTTSVTVYSAGSKYTPASNNMTLYAVYSKTKGGGSGFKLSLTVSSTTYYVGKQHGSDNYLSAETNSANAAIFTFDNGYLSYDDSGTKKYISITGNNTSLYTTTAKPAVTWTESGTTTYTYLTSAATRYLAYNGSANPVRFASYNNNSSYPQYFTKTSTATTYYCSDPNCCTQLASINGSVNWSNPTTAVVTWNKLADQVTSWALSWSPNTAGSSITSAIADAGSGTQKTATVSGLACGTEYTFTVTPTVKSGVCTPASNPTIVSTSTKYSITRSGSPAGTVTGGTFTTKISGSAVTEACNGSTIQIAATPATGYEFTSWTISKAGGGTVSPAASTASTTFTMPSDNVTVTAAFSCVEPVIGTDPASATYQEGASPTALSVAATLGSGTLTYLWKVSTDNGVNWSNATGTNNLATYNGASLSTASAGTLKFKCIVGNSDGGCSVESAVATITITAAQNFVNGATVFIQTGNPYSAWDASACVKAWFNNNGTGGAAQTTYWLYDGTGDNNGKKLFATIVPASGNLNQVTLQRFQSNCSDFYNNNGTLTKASDGGSNTFRTVGSGNNDVYWNDNGVVLYLYGDPNSWASSLGTFADQLNGVWTATYYNYAPANVAGESQEFKIKTSYNDDIGNTGSNNNATLSGMHVGSTYNITATLDVKDHSLVMSKTLVSSTVHFDMQSHGSAISDLTSVAAGATISAPSPAPTDGAYDFGGWFKEPECENEWNFASDVVNETMTLYAKWTIKKYAITYAAGDYGTGSVAAGEKTHGVNFTLSSNTFSRDHYSQTGWSINSNGSTNDYGLGGSYTANAAITLYPYWSVANYTVDWYVGGSAEGNKLTTGSQSTSVAYGSRVTILPTTPDGSACDKTFVGWTNTTSYSHGTSVLFTADNYSTVSPVITGNTQFYAVFAEGGSSTAYLTNAEIQARYVGSDPGKTTSYGNFEITSASGTWGGKIIIDKVGDVYYVQTRNNSDNNGLGSPTFSGNITNITVTGRHNAGSIRYIYICSSNSDGQPTSGDIGSGSIPAGPGSSVYTDWTDVSITPTGNHTSFYIYPNGGLQISAVSVTYSSYSNYTINCASCSNEVEVAYDADPAGGTVAVVKGSTPIAENGTVKTCTGSVALTVTVTPANAHFSVSGVTFTPSDGLTAGELSGTSSPASTTDGVWTYNVTIAQDADGTLTISPSFNEDAHKVITWVVHGGSASIADGHGTTWVYSGENLTAIPTAPDAPTGCDDKVFVGWSENDGGATEEDASYYDDRFTTLGEAPTGITTDKTFTAVFATPAAGLGGTVMWDEPWTGESDDATPSSQSASATVYNSTTLTYTYSTSTRVKTDGPYAGGTSPELLVKESGGYFTASNIPTAGQTSLTLTYKSNKSLTVSTNTSGVTVGDADVDGSTYTQTITIDQSGLGVANFDLVFTKTAKSNARLDDIHLVVPGSSSMSGYVTTCEDTWTVTYYKNTEDAVTNLPSPTGISKSTGSGTLSSKVPVRYGYTFDGWAISAGGSVVYAAGAAVSSVSADMDLYAKWSVTPVTEINLSKTSLDKYVGDPSVTLSVLSVLPDGANTSVTWSSSNSSIATVNSSTGEVNFVAEGTANIIATSTITSGTTATCAVTVWAKPTATFLDNLHGLTEDKDGNALSSYNLTDVAGTPVVFPVLANQTAGSGTCEEQFYVFVGWTTSDNNTDPDDNLVTSHNLTNGDNITYYAVWADGVSGTTYTKLTSSTFKTSPTKYVIGAEYNGTTKYFYSCENTDKNNSWGYVTADLASNTPIEFTLSGTAAALVATSTEVSARYLKPLEAKDFQMSASSQTVELKSDGTIYNPSTEWRLLYNNANSLRWYNSNVSGSANAYFYEVLSGGEVNYRTSCCADKVAAPTVTATKTSTTVTLTWAAVSGATGYELQWNGGAWTAATSGVVKSDLTPNTNYSWRVRATYNAPKCGADIASGSTTTNQVYHVTYAKGSGTGECTATHTTTDPNAYEAGATVTLQSNGFTLVGHTFNEWTEDDDDITISSNQFTMPEHDVVITATWTPKVDKFYDRMHDGTDASHGGVADVEGKYYITREGCSYTVPSLTDNTSGATACHTKHYVLMGWTAESHLNSDGTLKTGDEGYVYTGGGTQTATGATYYAVWAEVEE